MATPVIVADFETSLSTAISVGSTTFDLASVTDDDGVTLPTGTYYFTVDNGSSSKEYLTGSLSGSTVSSVKTVSRQGTETAGAARAHRVGAPVIITDFATYMKYMNAIALVSAPDASTSAKGVVEEATQAEMDAGTGTGGTGARLYPNPSTIRAKAYHDYAADAGANDAYAITITPAITAYATGQVFTFKANTANTGAATLNVSGLGAKTIKKSGTADLSTGDIVASQIVTVAYDGTNMQLLSRSSASTVYNMGSTTKNLADASTTQTIAHGLGVAPRKVRIKAWYTDAGARTIMAEGTWANSLYSSTYAFMPEGAGTATADTVEMSTAYVIKLSESNSTTSFQTATVSVDATNITLTWTKTSTPTETITFHWEAEG